MEKQIEFRTSGSTGTPKVIAKPEATLLADAAMLAQHFAAWFGDAEQLRVLSTISPEHMYGTLWLGYLMALVKPAEVRQVPSPESFLAEQAAAGDRPIILITTPSFLAEFLNHPLHVQVQPTVRAVVTSGSLLSAPLSQRATACFGACPTEIYGATETGSMAWRQQAQGDLWTLFEGVEAEPSAEGITLRSPFCLGGSWTLRDGVAFEPDNPRRFRLLGRQDRRVKVLEQWVDLPEVEAALANHPWIEAAVAFPSGERVTRIWVLVVLTAAGREALLEQGYGALQRTLRTVWRQAGLADVALPRRCRFVHALPYNERGKLAVADLQRVAAGAWPMPVIEGLTRSENTLDLRAAFPADHPFFAGHFPDFAILPGVAQLIFVRSWIRQTFGVLADGGATQLKFRQVVRPGQWLTLHIDRADADFTFTLARGDEVCASGKLTARQP